MGLNRTTILRRSLILGIADPVVLILSPSEANGSTTTSDYSSYGNVVNFLGSAIVSNGQAKFGATSIRFDGTTASVRVNDRPEFTMPGDFTWEAWYYPTQFGTGAGGANRTLFSFTNSSFTSDKPMLIFGVSGELIYYTNTSVITTSPIALNQWSFISVIRSGGQIKIFINGVQSGSTFANSTTINPEAIKIGTSISTFGELHGYLDDVRITVGLARDGAIVPTQPFGTENAYTVIHFDGKSLTDRVGNVFTLNGAATLASGLNLPNVGNPAISDYASTPDKVAFNVGSQNFTIEAIVRSSNWYLGADHYGFIFLTQRGVASQLAFTFSFYNGNIYLEYSTNGSSFISATFPFSPANNTDYIIGLTRNGSSLTCSVNNVLVGSLYNIGTNIIFDSTQPIRIGGDSFNAHGIGLIKALRYSIGISRDITAINPAHLL